MPTPTEPIREIVASQPSAAAILERFGIDLCLQAELPLSGACAELQLSIDQVLEKLSDAAADGRGSPTADPATLPTSRLIRHIVRIHHRQVRQQLPQLAGMAQKLAAKQRERAPELVALAARLEKLRAQLFAHIQKEELVLFPLIAQMDQELVDSCWPPPAHFHSVMEPIRIMTLEHDSADRGMDEMRELTNGYEPPDWACATHMALLGGLCAFEADLKQHAYLENDVLFPRAIQMETALKNRR